MRIRLAGIIPMEKGFGFMHRQNVKIIQLVITMCSLEAEEKETKLLKMEQ